MKRALLSLVLALQAVGCGDEPVGPAADASGGGRRDLNVVVLTLDTTRADALGAYGQSLPVTPRIDAMAARGVLFEQALAATPSTLPSHTTLFTGRLPFSHGVRSNLGYRVSEETLTLAEILRAAGWRTAAVVASPVLRPQRRLDQGFESYDAPHAAVVEQLEILQERPKLELARPAEEVTRAGLAFLRQNADADSPFLLWLHYFDPHNPYAPPEPFASRLADPYLAEVSRVDHEVGRILDEIERLGIRERTVVVLTADHGEGRGDHGEDTHAYFVYDSTMHVPLVFWGAPQVPQGLRVASLVRLADVAPTLLDLLSLPPLEGAEGRSLRPLFVDPEADLGLVAYGESIEWVGTFGGDVLRFVREGRWKYIHALDPELYDVAADPGERNDLAAREPARVERLRRRLEGLLAAAEGRSDTTVRMEPAELARLRALGYAGGEAPALVGDELASLALGGPDPSSRVEDLRVFVRAVAELGEGRWDAAEPGLARLWARNPEGRYVLGALAEANVRRGRDDLAAPLLRRALELDPEAVGPRLSLAGVLLRRGEPAPAERLLREALELEPCVEGAYLHLSALLDQTGRHEESAALLEAGVEACPDVVSLRNALAWALATSADPGLRDGPRAVRLAEGVVEETARQHPDYLDTLAAAYAETGDFERAVAAQRSALALVEGRDLPPRLVEPIRRHLERYEASQPIDRP